MIYDIFISYRREGGGATAGRINDMLTADGYSVSFDVDTLREGRFDSQLLERIEQCQDFILVVDKNCFVRTIDPATDPQDDWLWQELSYALKLKKNIIPVLLAGASFPKQLPDDIDDVRKIHAPTCVHEYFDSFYSKMKGYLHAYPRLTSYSISSTSSSNFPNLKLKADLDCVFYLDGEEKAKLKAGKLSKFPLAEGEYELKFVSVENAKDFVMKDYFEMPHQDKRYDVELLPIREKRLEQERKAEEARKKAEQERLEQERKEAERRAKAEAEKKQKRKRNVKPRTRREDKLKRLRNEKGWKRKGKSEKEKSEKEKSENMSLMSMALSSR